MKLLALLSSGIDSPVACYLMLKKGFKVEYLHFAMGQRSVEKTKLLTSRLKKFGGSNRFFVISHKKMIQHVLNSGIEEKYTCIHCKRSMLKIAEMLAVKLGCDAILMGDSLGQVASQTVPNLYVEDSAVKIPVLRPLIGLDKEEIIEFAKNAGTYEISIMKDEGCSAVPKNPVTRAKTENVKDVDVKQILNDVVDVVEIKLED